MKNKLIISTVVWLLALTAWAQGGLLVTGIVKDTMRKRPVNEEAYKELMARADAQIREIGEHYWGIDADQGYMPELYL